MDRYPEDERRSWLIYEEAVQCSILAELGRIRDRRGEGRWLPVNEAAQALGVSVEALRGRIKPNTMLSDLVGDKRVVWVSEPRPDTDQATDRLQSDAIALIFAKDETIAALRDQLEAERQAHAEARRLLMADLERIPPQLEAPREARESPQTVEEEPEGTERAPVEHRRASGGRKQAAAAPVVAQAVREVGRLHIT